MCSNNVLVFFPIRTWHFLFEQGEMIDIYVSRQAHVNVNNIAALEDVDQCVLYYNHAVILYHTRQYHSALTILDKLFQYVEPVTLQRKAMFLLIEIFLCTQQV